MSCCSTAFPRGENISLALSLLQFSTKEWAFQGVGDKQKYGQALHQYTMKSDAQLQISFRKKEKPS